MEDIKAKVINCQMLTDTVIELSIETYQAVKVIPGQRALFIFQDEQGTFYRAQSVVDQDTDNERTSLVFAMKLSELGRGSNVLKKISIGSDVYIRGIFGIFVLQDTLFPKVFIGTSIGITPVLNMAKYCTTKKQLLFSVSYKKDLFFEERIKNIPGLEYEIYITREAVDGYFSGRIDVTKKHFDPDTEFYLCGSPTVVDDIIKKLTFLGYKRIYAEKF